MNFFSSLKKLNYLNHNESRNGGNKPLNKFQHFLKLRTSVCTPES